MRIISVSGDSGLNHQIVVKPSGAHHQPAPRAVRRLRRPQRPWRQVLLHVVRGDRHRHGRRQRLGRGERPAEPDHRDGPAPLTGPPWQGGGGLGPENGILLFAGDGGDTINLLNGSIDTVTCDGGNDTLTADPFDQNSFSSGFGPPIANDCENRTPPGLPSP